MQSERLLILCQNICALYFELIFNEEGVKTLIENGEIIENTNVAKSIWEMQLYIPEIARKSLPGQFVNLRLADKLEPLLRRPISLHEIDSEKGRVSLLYMVVGKGTEMMSEMKKGENINVLGPLGHGWSVEFEGEYAVLVGGGIGIAPLYPLAEALRKEGKQVCLIQGAKSETFLTNTDKYEKLGAQVQTATDDGTKGYKGFVTDILADKIKNGMCDYVYACGPKPMLRNVEKIALKAQIKGEVSTESNMGCGLGVCLCCPNKIQGGGYKRTCKEGPVFKIGELDYE